MVPLTSAFTISGELGAGAVGDFPPFVDAEPSFEEVVGVVGVSDPLPHAERAATHSISPAIFRMAPPALSQTTVESNLDAGHADGSPAHNRRFSCCLVGRLRAGSDVEDYPAYGT